MRSHTRSTGFLFAPRAFWSSVALCVGLLVSNHAAAVTLGEAELRSALGESLSVRVAIDAREDETLDSECLAITPESGPYGVFRDARLALTTRGSQRFVSIRTNASVNEPVIRLVLRYACPGAGSVSRDYTLLLDPPLTNPSATPSRIEEPAATGSQLSAPAAASASPLPSGAGGSVSAAAPELRAPQWTVRDGDSLASVAKGIFPGSLALQARFVAAARAANPNLQNIADDAPLPAGSRFSLPDLRRIATRSVRDPATAGVTPARIPEAGVDPPATINDRRRQRKNSEANSDSVSQTRRAAPPAGASAAPPTRAPSAATKATTKSAKPKSEQAFSLRLSGGGVDLSRSQNVSDEQRALLREKQAMLDADDQVAQFLALKNSVKQLEKRLNELQTQLRVSGVMTAPAGVASSSAGPDGSASPPTQTTSAGAEGGTKVPRPSDAAAVVTPTTAPAASATQPTPSPTASATADQKVAGRATSPWWVKVAWGVLATLVLALLGWLAYRLLERRRTAARVSVFIPADEEEDHRSSRAHEPNAAPVHATPAATSTLSADEETSFAQAKRLALERERAQHEADERALEELRSARKPTAPVYSTSSDLDLDIGTPPSSIAPTPDSDAKASPAFDSSDLAAGTPADHVIEFERTISLDRPIISEAGARFELDDDHNTAVDFSLDEPASADPRLLRVQYMYERFSELQNKTVSIDNPASVVNAARLYFEEGDVAKANELLTFGVEERPQELSFWLAQFEIYRRAHLPEAYTELAQKFEFLFGQSLEWRKVRLVGARLAPNEPLFAGAASDAVSFDPSIDEWLGSTDVTARGRLDANAQQFRASMLREAGLDEPTLSLMLGVR